LNGWEKFGKSEVCSSLEGETAEWKGKKVRKWGEGTPDMVNDTGWQRQVGPWRGEESLRVREAKKRERRKLTVKQLNTRGRKLSEGQRGGGGGSEKTKPECRLEAAVLTLKRKGVTIQNDAGRLDAVGEDKRLPGESINQ